MVMLLETFIKYPVVFLAGLLVTLLLTPMWCCFAPRLGLMDYPGGRKIHRKAKPVGGGIAVFLGFHAACAAVFLLPWKPFAGQISIDWWFRFIPLSIGIVLLGLVDDRFELKPKLKLAGQILLAVGAYALNIRVQNVLGMNLLVWVDFCGTVFWFLAIMNAFNLIDGVDGLATGIALIAAIGIGGSLLFRHSPGDVLLLIGFAGACLGFLRYNFYPASIFLGDTGSLFLGFTLAALTISTNSKGPAVAAIGVPLLAVGVPLFDTALAIWRRSIRRILSDKIGGEERVAVDQGDAEHLHHRLLQNGRKHNQVAWVLYAATALLALTGILTTVFNDKIIGILGIAFVVTAYTVFRHIVWIELRDTGEVVLQGIARPVHRNLSLIVYIVSDLLILNGAWVMSTFLMALQNGSVPLHLKSLWLQSVPLDLVLPFLILIVFRSYSRAWSLAGIVEYMMLGLACLMGGVVACATSLFFLSPGAAPWGLILHKIVLFGLAIPAIVGIRAFFRVVQDLMHRSGRHSLKADENRPRILVGGAGTDLTLYFRRQATVKCVNELDVIVGILSDDPALTGHFINGYRVLGAAQALPALIRKKNVQELIWVGEVDRDELTAISNDLRDTGVRLRRWRVVEEDVPVCAQE